MSKPSNSRCNTGKSQLSTATSPSCPDGAAFSEISELFHELGSDHNHNLTMVLKFALEKVGGQVAAYRYFNVDRQEMQTRRAVSAPKRFCRNSPLKGHICYEAFVAEKQPHLISDDLSKTAYWDSDPNLKHHRLKAYIGCPVMVSGNIIGSLALFDKQPGSFNVHHLNAMTLLAGIIAFVEQHWELEGDLYGRLRREKMLSSISSRAVSDLEMEKCLANCVEILGLSMAADGALLLRHQTAGNTYGEEAHWYSGDEPNQNGSQHFIELLSMSSIAGIVERGHVFKCSADDAIADHDLDKVLKAGDVKALLLIPLFYEKHFYGCCVLYRIHKPQQWSEEDVSASCEATTLLGQQLKNHSLACRLREKEALIHQLFQLCPAAIYSIDFKSQRLVAVNDYLSSATGYSREELLAMNPIELLTPSSLENFIERMQDMAAGKPVSEIAEYEVMTKDGKPEWGIFHNHFIYEEGQIVGANVVATFYTNQRDAREVSEDYRKNLESIMAARVADLAKANQALRDEIEQRVQTTDELQASSQRLQEMNTAMRVLLDKRMEDHKRTEELIRLNLKELIDPYLTRLENSDLRGSQRQLVDLIRVNLDEVVASSMPEFASKYYMFSPNELQVVNLIRKGKTTKEMARLLNLSTRTVESYRDSIRKKLGLKNKKVNLRTYLSSI